MQKEDILTHPADGCVSQFGPIQGWEIDSGKRTQLHRSGTAWRRCQTLAAEFKDGGNFATMYLSPRDYHRVHMPCDGTLRKMIYVPGDLFSVNPLTAENVPNLFARNERVVCIFDTEFGPLAQVLVGATIVGSIEQTWAGTITPPRGQYRLQVGLPKRRYSFYRVKERPRNGTL